MKLYPQTAVMCVVFASSSFAQLPTQIAPTRVLTTLDDKAVEQPLRQKDDKAFVTVTARGREKTIEIEDKENLLNKRPDVPLTFTAVSTVPGQKAKIVDAKLTAVVQMQKDLDRTIDPDKQKFVANTAKAVAELDQLSKEAIRTGDEQKSEQTLAQMGTVKDTILQDYAAAPKTEHTVRDTLGVLLLRQKSVEKAWYGRDDNYRPEIYEMIYKQSRSCVGVVRHGGTAVKGSGVLVGPNMVLTAEHVVDDCIKVTEFDVLFDYEQVLDPASKQLVNVNNVIRRKVVGEYYRGKAVDNNSSPLDFVLLQIEPPAKPEQNRVPIPISVARVVPETPIFLVGHPRQSPRLIHDNSWVKFPYQVSEKEFEDLVAVVNGELKLAQVEDAAQEADTFAKCYKDFSDEGGHKSHLYIDIRGGKAVHCMGAECDTFHGDSGAPAILRETGDVIGILTAGEADQEDVPGENRAKSNAYIAGWLHHEIIIPTVKIVEQLENEKGRQWRQECGVTVTD